MTREEIARHRRWYGHGVFVYEPLHYLTLIETKPNALNQSAPLQGWDLPETFQHLSHLLEARIGNRGKREFVQVLRLMEGALEGDHDDRRDSGDPAVKRRALGTPPESIKSYTCGADRRRDPAPKHRYALAKQP